MNASSAGLRHFRVTLPHFSKRLRKVSTSLHIKVHESIQIYHWTAFKIKKMLCKTYDKNTKIRKIVESCKDTKSQKYGKQNASVKFGNIIFIQLKDNKTSSLFRAVSLENHHQFTTIEKFLNGWNWHYAMNVCIIWLQNLILGAKN